VLPDDTAVVSTDVESSFDVEEELLLQDANANMLAVKRHAINFIMINFVLYGKQNNDFDCNDVGK